MRCAVSGSRAPRRLALAVAAIALLAPAGPAAAAYATPSKLPTLRPRLGAAFHVANPDPAAPRADFAVDAALGYPVWVLFGEKSSPLLAPLLIVYPELSYTYQRPGLHLFTAGGFLGVGSRKIAVDWKALHFVPAASKRYGIVLADGGNIALTAESDTYTTHTWAELGIDSRVFDLAVPAQKVFITDFEVLDTGPRIGETYDCVRSQPQVDALFANGFEG